MPSFILPVDRDIFSFVYSFFIRSSNLKYKHGLSTVLFITNCNIFSVVFLYIIFWICIYHDELSIFILQIIGIWDTYLSLTNPTGNGKPLKMRLHVLGKLSGEVFRMYITIRKKSFLMLNRDWNSERYNRFFNVIHISIQYTVIYHNISEIKLLNCRL